MIGFFDRAMRRGRQGQATAEYIIIVALIAVAAIAVVTFFGDQIRNLFSHSTAKLAGDTDDEYSSDAEEVAGSAKDERTTSKTLGDF